MSYKSCYIINISPCKDFCLKSILSITHIFQTPESLIKYEYGLVFNILIISNFLSYLIKCNTILIDSNTWYNDNNNLSFLHKLASDQVS